MTKFLKNQKKTLLLSVVVAGLSIVLAFGIGLVFAWTDAPGPPTECPSSHPGCAAPINISSTAQTKVGDLNIGGGLKYWITKDGNSFALKNNAGSIKFTLGQDGAIIGSKYCIDTSCITDWSQAGEMDCSVCNDLFVNVTGDTMSGNLTVNGKITADEIDPVYNIEGTKYATYGHSTVGLKEETTGKVSLSPADNATYRYVIDFGKQEEGSDLWLFTKITDFGQNWEDLVVNLTPEGKAQVWYELKPRENKLVFYGDKEVMVSYRLIAPRFDWPERDTNLAPSQDVEGMEVK